MLGHCRAARATVLVDAECGGASLDEAIDDGDEERQVLGLDQSGFAERPESRLQADQLAQRSQRPRSTTSCSAISKGTWSETCSIARSRPRSSKGSTRPQRRQIA